MLKRISCDKFIELDKVREPIDFHNGLNTILGTSNGTNSIGKSTFLMIIDFVFGGKDYYTKKTKDVIDNVGNHTICFEFEFNGKSYYYSRSTDNPGFVNICDKYYNIQKTITLESYCLELGIKYGLNEYGISLREAVGRFFRVYHKDTTNEETPLRAALQESVNAGIVALIKLFNQFGQIDIQSKIKDEAKDKESTFNKAKRYNQIRTASSKSEYESNLKTITELENELKKLSEETENGLSELDAVQAQQLAEIKQQLSGLRRQRTQLLSQRNDMKEDRDSSKKSFKHDYDCLKEFFPNANYNELNDVENFHIKLSEILKIEYKESIDNIQMLLDVVNDQIFAVENQAKQIKTAPNVSKAILIKFAELTKQVEVIKEANKNYIAGEQLKTISQQERLKYENVVKTATNQVQTSINGLMKELNNRVYLGRKTSPTLEILDSNHYNFFTPNDSGTGSQCRGLIIFDLAVLNNTALPAIVHDSIILKNIEDYALSKLMELYTSSNKQVFIAFDRDETYSPEMKKTLNDTAVLRLSPGGHELFGRSWNEIKKED